MKTRRRLILGAVLVVVAGGLAFLACRESEPVYQGKRLTQWLKELPTSNMVGEWISQQAISQHTWVGIQKAEEAVLKIGSNAYPWLLRELDARDSWVRRRAMAFGEMLGVRGYLFAPAESRRNQALLALDVLGPEGRPLIRALTERLHRADSATLAACALLRLGRGISTNRWGYPISGFSRDKAALAEVRREIGVAGLGALGSTNVTVRLAGATILGYGDVDSDTAVPALIRGTQDTDRLVRRKSAEGLGVVTARPVLAIPALIDALRDRVGPVRAEAANSLGSYFRQARTAVPSLLKARSDPQEHVRAAANLALEKIDPETAAAIPDLPDFKPNLPSPVGSQ